MIKKVLLAYDGSEASDGALEFARALARNSAAELYVLSVVRPPEFGDDVETRAVIEYQKRRFEQILRELQGRLAGEPITGHYHVAVGHPAEQIVRFAEANGVDHIVVGHRGHGVFERWLIGSVARQVIAYAHCGVTVCRQRTP